jgi:DNA-binding NarL/FixJ family response regulator
VCASVHAERRLQLVACVADAPAAVAAAVEHAPRVCVLDASLPLGALAAAAEISARLPDVGIVLVHGEEDELWQAVDAGASAYVPRGAPASVLVEAVLEVARGGAVFSRRQVARLVEALRDPARPRRRVATGSPFTAREWQVLELSRKHFTTREIAEQLVVSPVTVRSHMRSIRQKLATGPAQR